MRRSLRITLALISAIFFTHAPSRGATTNWDLTPPSTGDWFTATNWSTDLTPGAADIAYIDNQGTAIITSGSATASSLYLGQSAFGNLNQTGGSLSLSNFTVNNGSTYQFSGGTLQINTRFDLLGSLNFASGSGTVNLANNGILDWSRGGMNNAQNATVIGGVGSTIYLPIGVNPYTLFKSFSTQGDVFNVSGPLLVVPAGFVMNATKDRADRMRIEGTVHAKDTNGNWTNFTASQAGFEVASGGLLDNYYSYSSLNIQANSAISGGTINSMGYTYIGTTNKPTTFTQSGGTFNASGPNGPVQVQNGSQYIQSGGTFNASEGVMLSGGSRYTQSGGTLSLPGSSIVTLNGAGDVFQQSGGIGNVGRVKVQSGGLFTFSGGTLNVGQRFDVSAGGSVDFASGNGTINLASYGVADFSTGSLANAIGTKYSAAFQSESYFPMGFQPYASFASFSSQGLVHSTGTRIVIPVTYSGRIQRLQVQALDISGKVTVDTGGSIAATDSVRILGGTLGGEGTVTASALLNAGVLSPGFSPGHMTVMAPYTQLSSGLLEIELGGTGQGTGYDWLEITGTATLGGTLDVKLYNTFLPPIGTSFDVLTASSITGSFANILDHTPLGLQLSIVNGKTLRLTSTSVPEPAAAVTTLILAMASLRRRRSVVS
ncbi:MAG TPA: hypothetical protein VF669_14270 [Tepidisphaeraceae bacterium]